MPPRRKQMTVALALMRNCTNSACGSRRVACRSRRNSDRRTGSLRLRTSRSASAARAPVRGHSAVLWPPSRAGKSDGEGGNRIRCRPTVRSSRPPGRRARFMLGRAESCRSIVRRSRRRSNGSARRNLRAPVWLAEGTLFQYQAGPERSIARDLLHANGQLCPISGGSTDGAGSSGDGFGCRSDEDGSFTAASAATRWNEGYRGALVPPQGPPLRQLALRATFGSSTPGARPVLGDCRPG